MGQDVTPKTLEIIIVYIHITQVILYNRVYASVTTLISFR